MVPNRTKHHIISSNSITDELSKEYLVERFTYLKAEINKISLAEELFPSYSRQTNLAWKKLKRNQKEVPP